MRFCLKSGFLLWPAGVVLCVGAAVAATLSPQAPLVRSIVKADAKGRLVRRIVVIEPPQPPSQDTPEAVSSPLPNVSGVTELVEATAKRYDVDPLLVHSVIQVESNYNPYAVSAKGAQGLMQLMPATARRFGVKNSFNVKENIEGGVRY